MDVLILRDPRESLAKCSLTPLRGHPDLRFVSYDPERRVQAGGRLLLHPEGSELGEADRGKGLLLVDCSWRRVDKLLRTVDGELERRRVSGWRTAYPRHSRTFADPADGLASVEALFAALARLERPRLELLEGYRWRDAFLEHNRRLLH
jgi:pre-rRNA-processing protein TSR3